MRAQLARPQWMTAIFSFALGACATVATQSAGSAPDAPAESSDLPEAPPPDATVLTLEEAVTQRSPKGGASIQHLAIGDKAYLGKLTMPAGGAVPVHRDTSEEYIHVLEGSGTITIDGEDHALVPGSTVFMPANAEVSYQNGDAAMVAIQVFAGPDSSAKYDAWRPPGA